MMESTARRLGNKRKKEPRIFLLTITHGEVRLPRGGNGYTLQYSCLGNPTDRGAWQATVHGVAKSQTQLSTHTLTSKKDCLFFTFSSHWAALVLGPWYKTRFLVPSDLRCLVSVNSCWLWDSSKFTVLVLMMFEKLIFWSKVLYPYQVWAPVLHI